MRQPPAHATPDPAELAEWCDAFDGLLAAHGNAAGSSQGKEQAAALLDALLATPASAMCPGSLLATHRT